MDLKNGVPVSIHLKTKVKQHEEIQEFTFDLPGQLVTIGDKLYIRYQEVQESGEEIPVIIKIMPDGTVQLTRSGEMRLRLKFDYKKKLETSYTTPYGVMYFGTFTRNLHVSLKDRPMSGTIFIDYDLYMADERVGEYQISLDFTA
ncbi:DUF1934 domain-containing protein [Enterococcus sp. MJM12]|uniref:DUF1934 domain-containing protein n=1 Tax=Candidatus Enterococcus myersii TaxID=2815322 RepID=A0ABS3HA60_9ENTE|nr:MULTISPECIES: DUF1934 domain-containing protein [Enterococcus]MBO0450339.1 DUF1934 domain-containing protein [Enterococcus sp. MJM12]MCD1023997.1 DUF1934 domain-containing protein [Enterococcus sp. SMC-9]MDT2739568.1 DUF1934 domain-containing protein [Enterococcus canintestini]WHA10015.1 DUF1934 domain-containing protein [Enterococcus montenegrensis]